MLLFMAIMLFFPFISSSSIMQWTNKTTGYPKRNATAKLTPVPATNVLNTLAY